MTRSLNICSLIIGLTTVILLAPYANASLEGADATSESVTLTWTAVGDDGSTGTASAYDIRYSESLITEGNWGAASEVADEPVPQAAGLSESLTIPALNPSTTYYFAIKVADEAGNWSGLSNVVQKTTNQETTAPSVIATLGSPSNNPISIDLAWIAPGDDSTNGTASAYNLRMSTSVIDAVNFDEATSVSGLAAPQIAGSNESFTVVGLSPSTTYYFAIKTADEVPNWSSISNVISVTTAAEQNPPMIVINLAVSSPTSTSLTVNWTAPGDDGNSGTATTYDLRYSTSTIDDANFGSATAVIGVADPSVAGSPESVVVGGLESNTVYYFGLKTSDEVPNWSGLSNVPSGQTSTETTPPAFVTNLGAANETETTITLSWTAPGDDGNSGKASSYDIRYALAPITETNWDSATEVSNEPVPRPSGGVESYVVTGLNSNTLYYIAIKTADEVPNWSALSNVTSRTTAPDQTPPSAIDDLQAASGAGDGEIILGWIAPDDGDASRKVAGYEVRASFASITEGNWSSAAKLGNPPDPVNPGQPQAVLLTGLQPGQFYFLAVKSFDEAGNVSPISPVAGINAGFEFATGLDDQIAELSSPQSGATLATAHPILAVVNVDPTVIDNYRFEVSADSSFYDFVAVGSVLESDSNITSWEVDSPLESGLDYFWRVRTATGSYSDVSSFTVSPTPHAYPNPFVASEAAGVTFTDLTLGANLVLTNINGQVVKQWTQLDDDRLSWDGTNEDGSRVASGVYMWYLSETGQKGKLVVVR